jgi:hypothetical protein
MICPRYALSIVLMASPFAALGLIGLVRRTSRAAQWIGLRARGSAAMAAVPIALVVVVGVASAMVSNRCYFASRKLAVALGRWVHEAPWTAPMVVGPVGLTPIMEFYADKGRYELFRTDTADALAIAGLVKRYHPDLLLLRPTKQMNGVRCEELAAQMKAQGFTEVDPVPRPAGSDPVTVLVRRRALWSAAVGPQYLSERDTPIASQRLAGRIEETKTTHRGR